MKMNIPLMATLLGLSLVVCPLMYIYVGPALDATQLSTLKTLGAICACSAIWCFVVGELTGNNSQMDPPSHCLYLDYRHQRRHAAPSGGNRHPGHVVGLPTHHEFCPERGL